TQRTPLQDPDFSRPLGTLVRGHYTTPGKLVRRSSGSRTQNPRSRNTIFVELSFETPSSVTDPSLIYSGPSNGRLRQSPSVTLYHSETSLSSHFLGNIPCGSRSSVCP